MKPQRNEACPCGSGRKFKHCCWRGSQRSQARPANMAGPSTVETNRLVAMIRGNRLAEAEIEARSIVDRFPTLGFGWKCLSVTQVMQGKPAMDALQTAAALLPKDAEAHCNLGYALRNSGRNNEALASYSKGLNLNPNNAEALTIVGTLFRERGRIKDAENLYRNAMAIQPDFAPARSALGDLCADRGRYSEARDSYRSAVEENADWAPGWVGLANCRAFDGDDRWLGNAQRLLQGSLRLQEAIDLRFAVGRYYDHQQDYEQAFASFKDANELTIRHGLVFDPMQATEQIDRIINTFGRPWMESRRAVANHSNRPVFVVGMPDSGAALAAHLLAVHPGVIDAGELGYWLARGAGRIDKAAQEYLQWLGELETGADRVIDRMPTNYLMIGMIHAALPNAHFIHVHRDPIDTCLAIYSNNFASTCAYSADLGNLAHQYREYLRLMQHWRSVLPAGVMLDLSYESLVRDPVSVGRTLFEFVGLTCLGQPPTLDSEQMREAVAFRAVGSWRNYEKFLDPLRNLELPQDA